MARAIIGSKLGMTQVWDDGGNVVPVTVVHAGPCQVTQIKTPERDGYSAVQLSFGEVPAKVLNLPQLGHLKAAKAKPARHLAELKVTDATEFELGQVIKADVFGAGEFVDVTGISKGKGFAGTIKRHNFSSQGWSHGVHKVHRKPGAVGACATPARVFKGQRMPGRMGNQKVTTLNLEVIEGDAERDLLLIKGALPGANGSIVFVREAVKGSAKQPRHATAAAEGGE